MRMYIVRTCMRGLLVALLIGVAPSSYAWANAEGHAKVATDRDAIHEALMAYGLFCGFGFKEPVEEVQPVNIENESFLDQVFREMGTGMAAYFMDLGALMSDEVRTDLRERHRLVRGLFGMPLKQELGVEMDIKSIEIAFPDDAARSANAAAMPAALGLTPDDFRDMRNEFGLYTFASRVDGTLAAPEAEVVMDIVLFNGVARGDASKEFKERRVLRLVKGEFWQVMDVR